MVGDFAVGVLDEGELFFEGFGLCPIAEDELYLGEGFTAGGGFFFADGLGKFADGVNRLGATFAVDARVAWDEGDEPGVFAGGGVGYGVSHGWGWCEGIVPLPLWGVFAHEEGKKQKADCHASLAMTKEL